MRRDHYFDLFRNECSFRSRCVTFKKILDGNGQSLLITLGLVCASLFLGGCDTGWGYERESLLQPDLIATYVTGEIEIPLIRHEINGSGVAC